MKAYFKDWLTLLGLALLAVMLIIVISSPVRAAGPWYVGPGGSDGATCLSPATRCATINGALGKAGFVAGDTIYVAAGTYTGSGSEVVLLDQSATLSGGWNASFTTQNGMSTIDGQGGRRGMMVNSGMTAIVERFVVRNGTAPQGSGISNDGTLTLNNCSARNNTAFSRGGGIDNNGGTLTLNDSSVSSNTVSAGGSGGISNRGILTLTNSTVSTNTALAYGGISNPGGSTLIMTKSIVSGNIADIGEAGGIFNGGTLTMTNSAIISNTARSTSGGGVYGGGILTLNNSAVISNTGGGIYNTYGGIVTLNNSTVSGNISGGGIFNEGLTVLNNSIVSNNTGVADGGGISNGRYPGNPTVTLNNSTVSGNAVYNNGGGVFNDVFGTLNLNSSTISNNTAGNNGGGISNSGILTLQNTIIAGNKSSNIGGYPDCWGTFPSAGYNLIGNTLGCSFTPTTGDLTNIDPKLGPLEGIPGYHPLLFGSPAINAGNPAGCMGSTGLLTTDQRGMPRVGRCDIGAYEYDGVIIQTFLPLIFLNY